MLLAYFDSSAIVPLLIDEPTTACCREILGKADVSLSSSLSYVETSAGLVKAERMGRITPAERKAAWQRFEGRWQYFLPIGTSDDIVSTAASLAVAYALRGHDAVQCATALASVSEDFCAVSGDRRLLRAWAEEGIVTIDINRGAGG